MIVTAELHRRIIAIIAAALCCPLLADADLKTKRLDTLNGPREFLRQSLLQSPEEARLLAAAERQLSLGENQLAFEALRAIFDHEHDSFTPVFPDKPASSTYRAAFQLLRSSDFSVRRNWTQSVELLASSALRLALDSPGNMDVLAVARRFPLTESGLKAMSLAALSAHSVGHHLIAKSLLEEMQQTYGQLTLPFDATGAIRSVQQQIEANSAKHSLSVRSGLAGQAVSKKPPELSLPWPAVQWRWEEKLWNNGAMATVIGGISLRENSSLLPLNSWRPALLKNSIILRTPARILAFEKLTGRIQWEVQTDTGSPLPEETSSLDERELTSRISLSRLLQMDELGAVTATENAVYFVDHFRTFTTETNSSGRRRGAIPRIMLNPWEPQDEASPAEGGRLVCLSLTPQPHVAWTIGTSEPFPYQVLSENSEAALIDASNATDTAVEDEIQADASANFAGQRFLGPPLVHERTLFVLSADRDVAWLNCLAQSSGRLLWKRPLAYHTVSDPGAGGQYLALGEEFAGASLCGVDEDTVLCVLRNGIVIGARLTDGQLMWATNFRAEIANPGSRLNLTYRGRLLADQNSDFEPQIADGRMVWAAPESHLVRCIDTQTGEILWTTSQDAIGGGTLEGSQDVYAVMADNERVVLVGTRHIRSLSMTDGSQQWITESHRQSGRAFANGSACLIPQLDGDVIAINLKDGQLIADSSDFEFSQDMALRGSVYADEQIVCVTTPLSVEVRKTTSQPIEPTVDGNDVVRNAAPLLSVRRHLLAGKLVEAIADLQTLLAADKSTPDERNLTEGLLANVLLSDMARQQFGQSSPSADVVDTSILDSLPLDRDQQWRYQLLSPNRLVMNSTADKNQPVLVSITPDWLVRSDVASLSLMNSDIATKLLNHAMVRSGRLINAEQAVLFPERVGDAQSCLQYAEQLASENRLAAAELLLLKSAATAQTPNDSEAISDRLKLLRNTKSESQPRLNASGLEFRFENAATVADNRLAQLIDVSKDMIETPNWYSKRLFIAGRKFHTVDMHTGAVSIPQPIPVSVEAADVSDRDNAPGLVPLVGTQHLGMISLTSGSQPELLWWKRIVNESPDFSRVEFGPLGPDFAVIANRSELFCLHPLTGAVLWQHRLTSSVPDRNQFQSTDWLIGDDRIIAVMGERSESCTLFRTKDGKRLKVLPLDIPRGQRPLISGRMLLYQFERRLRLVDLETGKDILWERPEIEVLRNGPAKLLSNHRAAFVNAEGSLCLLDMASGEILLTTNLGEDLLKSPLVGINVIERGGSLFLLAKDFGNTERQNSASSRMEDPVLASGKLYCIDSATGVLRWKRPVTSSVMPQIYGDPADLTLLWWWHDSNDYTERRLSQRGLDAERSLEMELLDSRTGKLVAAAKDFGQQEPLRCVHDANQKTISVHTDMTTITISYQPASADDRSGNKPR